MFARAGVVLCLIFGVGAAGADPIPVVQTDRLSASSVVAGPGASTVTVIYERVEFNLSIRMHLWATQSTDGGLTWSTPEIVPMGVQEPIPSSFAFQEHPSLVLDPQGRFVLFHDFRVDSPSHVWQSTSQNGTTFTAPDPVTLGWPAVTDLQPGSGIPSAVVDGPASMSLLYQRFVADGSDPAGLYLARSSDLGASWSPIRIRVADEASLGDSASLAYGAADGCYAAAYVVTLSANDHRVRVRVTDDASDWSAAPVLEVAGDSTTPFVTRTSDGAFVLFYQRGFSPQSELFMRWSADGSNWASEVRLTESADWRDGYPVAVPAPQPGFVDLY